MTDCDENLAWRIEETCGKAWPALQQETIGDWLACFSQGLSRRANSANPKRAGVGDVEAGIAACEAAYHARRLPAIFRIPSMLAPAADRRLEHLGYLREGDVLTLGGDLTSAATARDANVTLSTRPDSRWLADMIAAQGHSAERGAVYRRIVESVAIPAAFMRFQVGDETAALAYGAIHDEWLCCESVIARAPYRGRGYVRRMLAVLFAWAAERGARGVCLQVEAANAPALALYRRLGLNAELYRYHYRREPMPA